MVDEAMTLGGWAWVPALLAMALAGAATVAWMRSARALARVERGLQARLEPVARDLAAVCSAQRCLGDRLVVLEHEARLLMDGQAQLQLRTPALESYRHAITLTARGASEGELVSSCGLAPGEAALMRRIHQAMEAERTAPRAVLDDVA